MGAQPFANMFFFPSGLDHYCTEYDSAVPQTTTLHLSIISVHSPSHTPLYFESLRPSLALSSAHLCLSYKRRHSHTSPHTLCPTLNLYFSAVCTSVLPFCSHAFQIHFFPTSKCESFSNCICLPLLICECAGSVCPGVSPPGGCSSVNESLRFQTCCFVSYDKSVGAEPLPLQCRALSRRELGDSRATSGRQLHSLITERPG